MSCMCSSVCDDWGRGGQGLWGLSPALHPSGNLHAPLPLPCWWASLGSSPAQGPCGPQAVDGGTRVRPLRSPREGPRAASPSLERERAGDLNSRSWLQGPQRSPLFSVFAPPSTSSPSPLFFPLPPHRSPPHPLPWEMMSWVNIAQWQPEDRVAGDIWDKDARWGGPQWLMRQCHSNLGILILIMSYCDLI